MFWVDERVVPKDHPDSNYLLACDGLLSKVLFFFLNSTFLFCCDNKEMEYICGFKSLFNMFLNIYALQYCYCKCYPLICWAKHGRQVCEI